MPRSAFVILPEHPSLVTASAIAGAAAGIRSHGSDVSRLLVAHSPSAFRQGQWRAFQYGEMLQPSMDFGTPPPADGNDQAWRSLIRCERVGPLVLLGGREAAALCQEISQSGIDGMCAVHVPVCGGNSLLHTHHSIGYGSQARQISHFVTGEDLDNSTFFGGVKLIVIDGDELGWLAAAATLGTSQHSVEGDCREALLMATPFNWAGWNALYLAVRATLLRCGRATVVISGGLHDMLLGSPMMSNDSGLSSERLARHAVAALLAHADSNNPLKVRAQTYFPLRRSSQGRPLPCDQNEALWLAGEAMRLASTGIQGQSIVLDEREGRNLTSPRLVPAPLLAGGERPLPAPFFRGFQTTIAYLEYMAKLQFGHGSFGRRNTTVTSVPWPGLESKEISAS